MTSLGVISIGFGVTLSSSLTTFVKVAANAVTAFTIHGAISAGSVSTTSTRNSSMTMAAAPRDQPVWRCSHGMAVAIRYARNRAMMSGGMISLTRNRRNTVPTSSATTTSCFVNGFHRVPMFMPRNLTIERLKL